MLDRPCLDYGTRLVLVRVPAQSQSFCDLADLALASGAKGLNILKAKKTNLAPGCVFLCQRRTRFRVEGSEAVNFTLKSSKACTPNSITPSKDTAPEAPMKP